MVTYPFSKGSQLKEVQLFLERFYIVGIEEAAMLLASVQFNQRSIFYRSHTKEYLFANGVDLRGDPSFTPLPLFPPAAGAYLCTPKLFYKTFGLE